MRTAVPFLAFVILASCAEVEPADDLRARQEAACASVIAEHVRRPVSEVSARWLSESGGIARIETRDGDRLHLCDVDASGRVLGYTHPGA